LIRERQPTIARYAVNALCPANDGRSVPTDLVAQAESVIDNPHLPVNGGSAR
jgi:hypothetical protein